jgi:hypothetical protein
MPKYHIWIIREDIPYLADETFPYQTEHNYINADNEDIVTTYFDLSFKYKKREFGDFGGGTIIIPKYELCNDETKNYKQITPEIIESMKQEINKFNTLIDKKKELKKELDKLSKNISSTLKSIYSFDK